MNNNLIEKTIALVNANNPNRCETSSTKASTSAIAEVESRLKLSFHNDYSEFLRRYGSLIVSDCCISGLWGSDSKSTSRGTALGETLSFRERYKNFENKPYTVLENDDEEWYVLMNHTEGMIYTLDPFSESLECTKKCLDVYIVDFLSVFL